MCMREKIKIGGQKIVFLCSKCACERVCACLNVCAFELKFHMVLVLEFSSSIRIGIVIHKIRILYHFQIPFSVSKHNGFGIQWSNSKP